MHAGVERAKWASLLRILGSKDALCLRREVVIVCNKSATEWLIAFGVDRVRDEEKASIRGQFIGTRYATWRPLIVPRTCPSGWLGV